MKYSDIPEKWVVLRTKENAEELNEWCNTNYSHRSFSSDRPIYIHSDKWEGTHYSSSEEHGPCPGYTQLTWEEWKTLMSKPQLIEMYEIF